MGLMVEADTGQTVTRRTENSTVINTGGKVQVQRGRSDWGAWESCWRGWHMGDEGLGP